MKRYQFLYCIIYIFSKWRIIINFANFNIYPLKLLNKTVMKLIVKIVLVNVRKWIKTIFTGITKIKDNFIMRIQTGDKQVETLLTQKYSVSYL